MEKLLIVYPELTYVDKNITIQPYPSIFCTFSDNINATNECVAWSTKGDDHTDKLICAIKEVNNSNHLPEYKLVLIMQYFCDQFSGIPGFETTENENNVDIDIPDYDGKNDKFWNIMRSRYNVNAMRQLHIYTYGNSFIFEQPKRSQHEFNACGLRGSSHKNATKKVFSSKALLKLRGTNLKIQQEIREADLFTPFIENIIQIVETNNLSCISIFCRRGHHRSIACAEMLKHLYTCITVDHLTINL